MQCVRLIFPRSRMSQAVSVLFSSACMQNNKVYNWASTVEVFICMSARPRKHQFILKVFTSHLCVPAFVL